MPQTVRSLSPLNREDLPLAETLNPQQLDRIKVQIDLIFLALEALTGIGSDAMLQAANELNLTSVAGDRVSLWRLRQLNSWRNSGEPTFDVDEARSLVLISCHLANEHQELIRRAVSLLEQVTTQDQDPYRTALLGEYLDSFTNAYQKQLEAKDIAQQEIYQLAFKLLVKLLFYSATNGHRRLWTTLVEPS